MAKTPQAGPSVHLSLCGVLCLVGGFPVCGCGSGLFAEAFDLEGGTLAGVGYSDGLASGINLTSEVTVPLDTTRVVARLSGEVSGAGNDAISALFEAAIEG